MLKEEIERRQYIENKVQTYVKTLCGQNERLKEWEIKFDEDQKKKEEDLINDLRNLIGVYREMKGLVGSDILDIKGQLNEDVFQEEIQKGKRKELQAGAIQKKEKKQSSSSSSWSRDANMAFTALDNANFKCENDQDHETFIASKTGNQFVEAHHLIPMEYQGEFSVSIDVPENIISLCPNCHRAFHNSIISNQEKLISKFYEITGVPILVNTSFNIRGEPIVCSVEDAYRCFLTTELDFLVCGNQILEREKQIT